LAEEIVHNLYLGNLDDAFRLSKQGFKNICVLEYPETVPVGTLSRPILDPKTGFASTNSLTRASWLIYNLLRKGHKVLVHCAAGIERSPLTIAWYLVQSGRSKNLTKAYDLIFEKRPIVQSRLNWLPFEAGEEA
jgi:protein-tyrosine phosphatase